jgi:hypothetical protein
MAAETGEHPLIHLQTAAAGRELHTAEDMAAVLDWRLPEHAPTDPGSLPWLGTPRVRGTLARVNGKLEVTEPQTAKSKRAVPLSEVAVRSLRAVRTEQALEHLRAGSRWHQTGFVFVTEFGEPCEPCFQGGRQACGIYRARWACTLCATLPPQ